MAKTKFTVDSRDFNMKFDHIVHTKIPGLAQKGLFNASAEALRDADFEDPKLPFLKGDLRGSREIVKPSSLKDLFIEFGFNIVYAAKLHEDGLPTWNWSREGSGPKFLTTKLVRHKDKYMKIVAQVIKDGQGST